MAGDPSKGLDPNTAYIRGKPFITKVGSDVHKRIMIEAKEPSAPAPKQQSAPSMSAAAAQALSPEGAMRRKQRLSLLGQA